MPTVPPIELRAVGATPLRVSPVALGCWPMAGVTTLGATHADGVATVHAALDSGVNHFDTAYVYGPNGESDRILAEALRDRRDDVVLASKVGVHYEPPRADGKQQMANDGRPATLRRECDELLARLGTDHVNLLYLHSPDPKTPIADSAGELRRLMEVGKTRSVGASNCQLDETQRFAAECPLAAVQLPYNMLQRDIEQRTLPWCRENRVAVMVYWSLMKGLLAGKMGREHKLAEDDSRRKYPMYVGDEWRKNQDFLDELRAIASALGVSVRWTLGRPGVTSVLCGAKRPEQIAETAAAMRLELSAEQVARIEVAVAARGSAETKRSFT